MDNNNLIVAVVLSVMILIGFQYLYVKPQQEQYRQQVLAESLKKIGPETAVAPPAAALRDRALVVKDDPRVPVVTPELSGSIDLRGARIDDLALVRYRENIGGKAASITLLSPPGSAAPHQAYYAEFSWLADQPSVAVPTAQTEWKAEGKQLSPDHPLKLTWDNGQGLGFERTLTVDDQFMFTLTDRVVNKGAAPVTLYPFGLIARQGNPAPRSMWILHEGPIGVLNGTLEEHKYKKLMEQGKVQSTSDGGWLGITDKYWLVAMMPAANEKIAAEFSYGNAGQAPGSGPGQVDPDQGHFQTDFRGDPVTIAPGASIEHTARLFAGAKRLRLLDRYADLYNIPHFDRAIDFGWFYFLTKPFLYLLDFLGGWFGNFGLAILLFTVALKLLTLPLSLKSNHSMARMKALQPEIERLQERFADDKTRQSQELMEFYKREKINPMSGCAPQLIQIPIFFALYKILYVGIELRQAPFFGWIHDMSAADPTSVVTLFGLFPWMSQVVVDAIKFLNTLPSIATLFGLIPAILIALLHLGVWPILMGISSFTQQRLSPQPPDKSQARMFAFMPVLFTFMLAQMPSGLVIYWTWSNVLSSAQQWFIMRRDAKRKGEG